jgi:type I restriction enzyme, S subunit
MGFEDIKKLEDVAYLAGRIGWKGLTAKEYTSDGPLFLSVHSLNYGDYVDFGEAFHISEERYDESPEIMLRADDILLCKDGAGIGKLGIIHQLPDRATINSSLLLIRASENISPKYLYHALCSPIFQRVVQERIDGATTPHLYQREIKQLKIPIPPLPEQQRIVAILDEAFAGIDAAIANTEKNLANARELFDSYLNNVFTQKGDGWVETNIGQHIELLTGFAFKSKDYSEAPDAVTLLRGDNILQGSFRWEAAKKWPKNRVAEFKKYLLSENDVVLAMDRTWVKAGIKFSKITEKELPCLLVQRVARLRATKQFHEDFLFHLIGSKLFSDYVLSIQTGLGVPHISGKQIQAFEFSLPNIEQQREIVQRLGELSSCVQRLENNYQQKFASLNELKQSILQKAFSGELTKEAVAA